MIEKKSIELQIQSNDINNVSETSQNNQYSEKEIFTNSNLCLKLPLWYKSNCFAEYGESYLKEFFTCKVCLYDCCKNGGVYDIQEISPTYNFFTCGILPSTKLSLGIISFIHGVIRNGSYKTSQIDLMLGSLYFVSESTNQMLDHFTQLKILNEAFVNRIKILKLD
ncbi:MAG: hypothetical protein GY830_08470 [Bacteroidetes bacterium]|nr:hypothetical protein [Bacteroidota bacterium]